MTDTQTWMVTGATRGIGADIVRAALEAGDNVMATGRDVDALADALPASDRLALARLDVCKADEAEAAVAATRERFGRIDVLVNNAGYGQLGLFEEVTDAQIRRQYETNVLGLMTVTRAALPSMRAQRGGHIFNLSSVGGVRGSQGGSIYCSTKFAVEGFSEGLAEEVAPFGIRTTIVEPGFFRTDFLDASSIRYGDTQIGDYKGVSDALRHYYTERNHQQAGDPAKLAAALVTLSRAEEPPLHFAAGSDAVGYVADALERRSSDLSRWRELSVSTDLPADG